jgi:hypothetical protein
MATFFGIQVACSCTPGSSLRRELAECVALLRKAPNLLGVRTGWTRTADVLRTQMDALQLGSWELITESGESHYDTWSSELEAMADWTREDFGNGNLLLITMIAMITSGSEADASIGNLCDLPERDWHRRSTYQRLLTAMPKLALADVPGSALYVAPRPDQPGFSHAVLSGEGYEYLRKIS